MPLHWMCRGASWSSQTPREPETGTSMNSTVRYLIRLFRMGTIITIVLALFCLGGWFLNVRGWRGPVDRTYFAVEVWARRPLNWPAQPSDFYCQRAIGVANIYAQTDSLPPDNSTGYVESLSFGVPWAMARFEQWVDGRNFLSGFTVDHGRILPIGLGANILLWVAVVVLVQWVRRRARVNSNDLGETSERPS